MPYRPHAKRQQYAAEEIGILRKAFSSERALVVMGVSTATLVASFARLISAL